MINSRHILNLSIELIIKPQALDRTSCYKCNCTKREAGLAGVGSKHSKHTFIREGKVSIPYVRAQPAK